MVKLTISSTAQFILHSGTFFILLSVIRFTILIKLNIKQHRQWRAYVSHQLNEQMRGGGCLRRNKWMWTPELQFGPKWSFSIEFRRPSVENISCVSLSVTDWKKFLPSINSDGEEAQLDWSYLIMYWGYMDDIYRSIYYRLDLFLKYHKTFYPQLLQHHKFICTCNPFVY